MLNDDELNHFANLIIKLGRKKKRGRPSLQKVKTGLSRKRIEVGLEEVYLEGVQVGKATFDKNTKLWTLETFDGKKVSGRSVPRCLKKLDAS